MACGGVSSSDTGVVLDGGAGTDASSDAPIGPTTDAGSDAPAGAVATLVVSGQAGPAAGVSVFFHDAKGELIETKTTGPDGKVTRAVDPAGTETATVVTDFPKPPATVVGAAFSIFGIKPGDVIPIPSMDQGAYMRVNASLPGFAGASQYVVACNGISTPNAGGISGQIDPDCRGAATLPLVVAAMPTAIGHPLAYTFKKGIPFEPSKTSVVTGFPAWLTDVGRSQLTSTNKPAGTRVERPVQLFHIVEGVLMRVPDAPEGPDGDQTFATMASAADAYVAVAAVTDSAIPVGVSHRYVAHRLAAAPAAMDLDLATLAPPILGLDASGQLPLTTITWPGGSIPGGDAIIARIEFGSCAWTMMVPPGSLKVTTPSLPGGTFSCMTQTGGKRYSAMVVDSDAFATYDAARPHVAALAQRSLTTSFAPLDMVPALPVAGVYRLSLAVIEK